MYNFEVVRLGRFSEHAVIRKVFKREGKEVARIDWEDYGIERGPEGTYAYHWNAKRALPRDAFRIGKYVNK